MIISKVAPTIIIVLACIAGLLYYLVTTPKKVKLQPILEERMDFNYSTSLSIEKDTSLGEMLYLRRVRNSDWKTSGPHTDFKEQDRKEPSMSVSTIKPDAYLKQSAEDPNRIIIGRYSDVGSGMHGWHVTMIRQGTSEINFDRHQRYYVWIEKDFPTGFNDQGEPISDNPERWFFAGPADIVAKDKYNGYIEPVEGDK